MAIPTASSIFGTNTQTEQKEDMPQGTTPQNSSAKNDVDPGEDVASEPPTVSTGLDTAIEVQGDNAVEDFGTEHTKSSERVKGLEQEQYDKEKTDLNKNNNAQYATGGGQYGRFNNRSYGKTLRLAREADAYNNRPDTQMIRHSVGGTSQIIGTVSKPKLETMETRAMEQTQQLDTQQKILAQELQAAVNRKDLDAFIKAYEQLYNRELSRYEAEIEMRRYVRTTEIENYVKKDFTKFEILARKWGMQDYTNAIWQLTQKNPLLSKIFCNLLAGFPLADDDMMMSAMSWKTFWTEAQRSGAKPSEMNYYWKLFNKAQQAEQAAVDAQQTGKSKKDKRS